MNSALFLLNAIAIAVLVAFHFQPVDSADPVGLSSAGYNQHPTPQLAVMNTQIEPRNLTRITQEKTPPQPAATPTERWIF
ncbi:hypothetical protein BLX41_22980 [Pseudomonas protegens]|uniref:hypothetical protein n=1 Tax=Pseudomonas protegens TaxID=380021 RepID=UPI000F4BC33E|nr:hypothetical protein [Pseudomonas protegens]ROL66719.1 hypothetical protein BLX41_22980 [Pseudomonas protegens]